MAKRAAPLRSRLLDAAQRLMLAQGYAATSIDQVCQAADATKGAFFHYFSSKDDLADATLERFVRNGLDAYAHGPFLQESDPVRRFDRFIDFVLSFCTDPVEHGCLIGVLAQELSPRHSAIRARCHRALTAMAMVLRAILDDLKTARAPASRIDTRGLATMFVAVFEGGLLLARAADDIEPFRLGIRHYANYVRLTFAAVPSRKAGKRTG